MEVRLISPNCTTVASPRTPSNHAWLSVLAYVTLAAILTPVARCDLPVSGILHRGDVDIAAILPDCTRRLTSACMTLPFSRRFVSWALEVAVDSLRTSGQLDFISGRLRLRYANSGCDSAVSVNEAINYYLKQQVHVFIGPCCDYAAAPIARQITYWNLPMITSGAMAADFGLEKSIRYPMMTRMGANINHVAHFMKTVIKGFNITRVKMIYDRHGQSEVYATHCHLMIDGLHQHFRYNSIVQVA